MKIIFVTDKNSFDCEGSFNAAFKAARTRNRPLRQHLFPLHRSTDVDAEKVVTLPWHACQSLMYLRLLVAVHEGSRRRGAGNLFLLAMLLPPSRFLSSHLDSGTFIPWWFRRSSCFFCPPILFPLDSLARRFIS